MKKFAYLIVFLTGPVFALEPNTVNLGPVEMTPTLTLGVKNNSNIYATKNNKRSSTIYTVNPELFFLTSTKKTEHTARIYLNSGTYAISLAGEDDYYDYGSDFNSHFEFNSRNRLDAYFELSQSHDERGSAFSVNDPYSIDEPDIFRTHRLGGAYEFGHADKRYVSLEAFNYRKTYRNNFVTNGTAVDSRVRNYTQNEIDVAFHFAVSSKVFVFTEVDFAAFDYEKDDFTNAFTTLDSTEVRFYIGTTWDINDRFDGSAKIGQSRKDFKDNTFDDTSYFSWDVSLNYIATSLDKITFSTGSNFDETQASGSVIETRNYELAWAHYWLSNFNTRVRAEHTKQDHGQRLDPTIEQRNDKTNTFGITATFNATRWMDMELDLSTRKRSSNIDALNYSQNIIALNFIFSL